MKIEKYSDYMIFVDESGDHGLTPIDKNFPVFALVFVLVKKKDYTKLLVPRFQEIKLKYWGHDQIIFHETDIRKGSRDFTLLRTNPSLRESFLDDINSLIQEIPFTWFASVIHKEHLKKRYGNPYNPYEIGLLFCLEKVFEFLKQKNELSKQTHILVEARGKKEDNELELEFRRICDNQKTWGYKEIDFTQANFVMKCVSKKSNSSGLQLADLIARPIALDVIKPFQGNRAYQIIKDKIHDTKIFPFS